MKKTIRSYKVTLIFNYTWITKDLDALIDNVIVPRICNNAAWNKRSNGACLKGHDAPINCPCINEDSIARNLTNPTTNTSKVRNCIRCGPNNQVITTEWWTEGGTAKPGVDYVPAAGTLSFPANQPLATLALELIDNVIPDGDRTVRIRLRDANPAGAEYPFVELTITNDDLGFLPGGIRPFANGRVLLRTTPGDYWPGVESSRDLSHWSWLGQFWAAGNGELIDTNAPGDPQRFYRLAY